MDIKDALSQLDPLDDDQWTEGGQPKIEAVASLLGHKVTRKEITEAAPQFSRDNPIETEEESDAQEEGVRQGDEEVDYTSAAVEFFEKDLNSHKEVQDAVNALPKEILSDMIRMMDNQMMDIESKKRELENLRGMMKYAKAVAVNRAKSETPDMDNQSAIREFLAAQHKARAEKVAATKEIFDKIDISKIDPRSPIDRAMARKTGRGRPVHPVRG